MIISKNPARATWESLCERPALAQENLQNLVQEVFSKVKAKGDDAIISFTKKFDKVELTNLCVSNKEILDAEKEISNDLKAAIQLAAKNIEKFHIAQLPPKIEVETVSGVTCWQEARPIDSVGIYIPGGSAPLFSTVLMLALPAKIAGCKNIILCTPPNSEGKVNPAILYAAKYAGVSKICMVGGIQAIAAFTFGTNSISQVNKILGPGNQYVTAAKQYASQLGVAIDMPAGPSELLVLADNTAIPSFIASDMLSQAEHGADSQVICVVTTENLISEITLELEKQIGSLSRKKIAKEAIKNSKIILIEEDSLCIDFINTYAPEHFIVCVKNEDFFIEKIINAGSVFIGNYTPESAGDYASGTNHTLPTNASAKAYSGVNIDSFMKKITFQKITKKGIKTIGPAIEIMAEAEQLGAHKQSVTQRLNYLKKSEISK